MSRENLLLMQKLYTTNLRKFSFKQYTQRRIKHQAPNVSLQHGLKYSLNLKPHRYAWDADANVTTELRLHTLFNLQGK